MEGRACTGLQSISRRSDTRALRCEVWSPEVVNRSLPLTILAHFGYPGNPPFFFFFFCLGWQGTESPMHGNTRLSTLLVGAAAAWPFAAHAAV